MAPLCKLLFVLLGLGAFAASGSATADTTYVFSHGGERELIRQAEAQAIQGDYALAFETIRSIGNGGHRAAALTGIAEAQARDGDVASAIVTAQSIGLKADRTWALCAIARTQVENNDLAGAQQTLAVALVASRADGGVTLGAIADVQEAIGDLTAARLTREEAEVKSLSFNDNLNDLLFANQSRFDTEENAWLFAITLEAVERIPDPGERARVRLEIAEEMRAGGDLSESRDMLTHASKDAAAILVAQSRSRNLSDVAMAQAQVGDVANGLVTARLIEDPTIRAVPIASVALAQNRAGDTLGAMQTFDLALEAAQSINNTADRDSSLATVALGQSEIGGGVEALATTSLISSAGGRNAAMNRVAQAQTYAGTMAAAIRTATTIPDAIVRDRTFGWISNEQTRSGDMAGALETAGRIGSVRQRGISMALVARAQTKAGDLSGARITVGLIEDPDTKDRTNLWISNEVKASNEALKP